MTHLLYIFLTGFVTVFLYGFQSRNVNHGNYAWAAGTSFAIALTTVVTWELLDSVGWLEVLVYGSSGALGVTLSMVVHKRYVAK